MIDHSVVFVLFESYLLFCMPAFTIAQSSEQQYMYRLNLPCIRHIICESCIPERQPFEMLFVLRLHTAEPSSAVPPFRLTISNALFAHELLFHGNKNADPSEQLQQHILQSAAPHPSDVTLSFPSLAAIVWAIPPSPQLPSLLHSVLLERSCPLWNVVVLAFDETVDTPSPFEDIDVVRKQLMGLIFADNLTPYRIVPSVM